MQTNELKLLPFLSLLFPLSTSVSLKERGPTCTDITIPVTITANNTDISKALPGTGLTIKTDGSIDGDIGTALGQLFSKPVNFIYDQLIHGTWNVAGRYCEPQVFNVSRQNTLQIMFHGAVHNKEFFSGTAPPGQALGGDTYSQVAAASAQGYPSLVVDNLGSGNSDHPDPITVVQSPALVEMYHQIILQARSNSLSLLPRAFTKIIFVGQQYGSILGNNSVAKYPTDVDALVLTGYSSSYVISGLIVAASLIPAPAALIAGQHKWANLQPAYFTSSSQSGYDADFFWAAGRDPAISAETFQNRDTVALGILITFEVGVEITNYAGPVYMSSGQRDQLDCRAQDVLAIVGSLLGAPPDCGTATSGSVAQTKNLFPHASSIDINIVPNSGLDWQLHYNPPTAFTQLHAWLAGKGF